jgi:hypothetical protein
MAITSTKPTIVDGVEYPLLLVNLAISPLVQEGGQIGASVAMRLTPYREIPEGIEQLPEHAKAVSYFDVFKEAETDPEIASAIEKIMTGIQEFINDKGL